MASMMITVDELKYKKTIYSKAAKNLRDVIAVVKKASNSIGNDRMFNEARANLKKLAEILDRRATVLEALAEALVYSTDTYKSAQKHSVSQISEYKAHKTDFYGRPVHVSGAAASGAAAATGSAAASASTSASSGSVQSPSSSGSSGNVSSGSTGSVSSVDTQSTSSTSSESYTDNSTVNITNNTVINDVTENIFVSESDSAASGIAAETVSGEGSAVNVTPSAEPEVSTADGDGGISVAAMLGGGIAAAAGVGAAAFGASKIIKKKAEDNSIDHKLEEAKKKLQAIEDEQDELRSSIEENEEDEGKEQ